MLLQRGRVAVVFHFVTRCLVSQGRRFLALPRPDRVRISLNSPLPSSSTSRPRPTTRYSNPASVCRPGSMRSPNSWAATRVLSVHICAAFRIQVGPLKCVCRTCSSMCRKAAHLSLGRSSKYWSITLPVGFRRPLRWVLSRSSISRVVRSSLMLRDLRNTKHVLNLWYSKPTDQAASVNSSAALGRQLGFRRGASSLRGANGHRLTRLPS